MDFTTYTLAKKYIDAKDFLPREEAVEQIKEIVSEHISTDDIEALVNEKIAAVVDGAPETLDTLKEVSSWIDSHTEVAADIIQNINTLNGSEDTEGSINNVLKQAKEYTDTTIPPGMTVNTSLPSDGIIKANNVYILGTLTDIAAFTIPPAETLGDMFYISYTIPQSSYITIAIGGLEENTIGLVGHLAATTQNAFHEIVGIALGEGKWSCVSRDVSNG